MTEENGTYNGYTNYETWLVSLWFGNARGYYHDVLNILKKLRKNTAPEALRPELADALKEYLSEIIDKDQDKVSGISSDYLGRLVPAVDFDELAEDMLTDYPEDEPGDD